MSLLGSFYKQPIETEFYSISYVKDLSATDSLEKGWVIIASDYATAWDFVTQLNPYTVTAADNGRILVGFAGFTLPVGAPAGFRVSLTNMNSNAAISADGFIIPPSAAIIAKYTGTAWVEEVRAEGIMVSTTNDERMRVKIQKGEPYEIYKVQVTVDTEEGRTLQDEFLVTIEEN